jgi:hypothetical protein
VTIAVIVTVAAATARRMPYCYTHLRCSVNRDNYCLTVVYRIQASCGSQRAVQSSTGRQYNIPCYCDVDVSSNEFHVLNTPCYLPLIDGKNGEQAKFAQLDGSKLLLHTREPCGVALE